MDASVRLDHTLVAVESEHSVHAMLELAFPEGPDAGDRPPLHVALVLDRSGSMEGAKLETTKACAAHLVQRLRPTDQVAIVAYDDEVTLVAALDAPDTKRLGPAISSIHAGGSTNLSGGWLKGLEELRRAPANSRRALVLLTDGHANVGVVEPDQLVSMVDGGKGQQVTTTTIGLGDGFDEDLLTRMADAAGGNAHYAATADAAPAIFAEEFDGLAATVAQNVSIELRPSTDVAVLAVLHDYPIADVPGGLQIALGDAWGGETRRVVFRLGVPALADLGPATVCDAVVRWVDVTGTPALHERTVPVVVNVAAADEAGQAVPDAEVVEEVVVLEAARTEREARRLADEGDFDAATGLLSGSADQLRRLAPVSARAAELVDGVEASLAAMTPSSWDAAASKTMHYRSRGTSRRRR